MPSAPNANVRHPGSIVLFVFIFVWYFMPLFLIAILLTTRYWWSVGLYYVWVYWDRRTPYRGGRPSDRFRRFFLWKYVIDYFPIRIHKTDDLPPDRNYICGIHPHGAIATSFVLALSLNETNVLRRFPGLRRYGAALSAAFYLPILREIMLAIGGVNTSMESLDYVLRGNDDDKKTGKLLGIAIGGIEESLYARPGSFKLVLKNRRGFIRLAMRHGASLVPIYSFGENDLFYQVESANRSWLHKTLAILKKFLRHVPPLFYGEALFFGQNGIVPRRVPLNSVVGAPITVAKNENPSREEINALHNEYCRALRRLFDDNKCKFGIAPDVELELI